MSGKHPVAGNWGFRPGLIEQILGSDHPQLELALTYARAGIPVFPCNAEKRPLVKWRAEATTDEAQIREWWTLWTDALVGLPTGFASKTYVIDLDVKNGKDGIKVYQELGLPKSEIAGRTASGGGHVFFRWPGDGWTNKDPRIGPGVDARGEGGFVIAPLNQIGGGIYGIPEEMFLRLLNGERPEMPKELMDRLRPIMEPHHPPGPKVSRPKGLAPTRYGSAALENEVAAVASATEGNRNSTLNTAAFNLAGLVSSGDLDRDEVWARLSEAGRECGLPDQEVRKTIASGYKAGEAFPRNLRSDPSAFLDDGATGTEADWPEPDLSVLEPEREDPPVCPVRETFGEGWGNWIETSAEARNAPVDYVVAGLLPTAASLIGNSRRASVFGAWREPCIIWSVLVGSPSSRKSPGLKAVREPLEALQSAIEARMEPEIEAWRRKADEARLHEEAWKEETKQNIKKALKRGGTPTTGSRPAEADPGPRPIVPKLFTNDATPESIPQILADQPRGTLFMRDEFSGLLFGMDRYRNGRAERAQWLESYDGGSLSSDRVGSGRTVARMAVSLIGTIQPQPLQKAIAQSDEDGFFARLLPFWPLLSPVKRPVSHSDGGFARRAFEMLLSLEMAEDDDGRPIPVDLPLSSKAQDLVEEFSKEIADLAETSESAPLLAQILGKLAGTSVRIAIVLAHLDWTAGGGGEVPREISADVMQRSIRFARGYLYPMARRTYAGLGGSQTEKTARLLVRMLVEHEITQFTARDVYRKGWAGLERAAQLYPALDLLEDAAIIIGTRQKTGGKDKVLYHVNPHVRDAKPKRRSRS